MSAGYYASPWPAEDAGPARLQTASLASGLRLLAGRHLIQIHVIQPERLAVSNNGLFKRFAVNESKPVWARKLKTAAGCLGPSKHAILGWGRHKLGEFSPTGFGHPEEIFQAF